MKRCSPSTNSSSIVKANGSLSTPFTIREGNPMFLTICIVLSRIKLDTHWLSICTMCIYCNREDSKCIDAII